VISKPPGGTTKQPPLQPGWIRERRDPDVLHVELYETSLKLDIREYMIDKL